MEYDETDIVAVGDIPPGLEDVMKSAERVISTVIKVGRTVVEAAIGTIQGTATEFDTNSALFARR